MRRQIDDTGDVFDFPIVDVPAVSGRNMSVPSAHFDTTVLYIAYYDKFCNAVN